MEGDQYKDLYILVVKANTTWEGEIKEGENYVLPLTETTGSSLVVDGEDLGGMVRLLVLKLPDDAKKFEMKNTTDKNRSYIMFNA